MTPRYSTPLAFKQALEQRLKSSSTTGVDFARRRQLLVFDRFLARVASVVGDAVTLKGGLVLEMRVRVPLLVPRLGVRIAELLEVPVMFLVIVLSARFVVSRFTLPPGARTRLSTGFVALALLVAAELSLAALVQGQTVTQYIASRDPVSGSVYLAMLGLFAAMPLLLARVHAARSPSAQERAG